MTKKLSYLLKKLAWHNLLARNAKVDWDDINNLIKKQGITWKIIKNISKFDELYERLRHSEFNGILETNIFPGEISFAVLDLSKNDYVDLREFVHGFFKVYYSNLETKIKLSFDV